MQPEDEIDVVGRFHDGRRQVDASSDLVAERAGEMSAHQRRHRPSQRAVRKAFLHVRELGIEPLRVADRELELGRPGERHQLVGLLQLEPHRLLEEHVLARKQAVARERIVSLLGRRGHDDRVHVRTAEELPIVGRGAPGARLLGHLLEPVTVDLAEVQALDQGMGGARPGPEPADPAHADDAHVDRAGHLEFSTGWIVAGAMTGPP
jgi:hypothetical protein